MSSGQILKCCIWDPEFREGGGVPEEYLFAENAN